MIGNFEIGGRMLLLPITGTGPCNITLDNLDVKAVLQGIYVEHHEKTYMYLQSFKAKVRLINFA